MWGYFKSYSLKKSPFLLYFFSSCFILGWWFVAFKNAPFKESNSESPFQETFNDYTISTLDRKTLLKALRGDFQLMIQLIGEWDIEAKLLQEGKIPGIERLPKQQFLESQKLKRALINEKRSYPKLLPQTYVAASFLLTLADTDQLVALPKGLREQISIYPKSITEQIPLDIDRYHSEKIFLAKPEVAFISLCYSQPAMVDALQRQGLKISASKNLSTLSDIEQTLLQIGHDSQREVEAKCLLYFMRSAFLALENRLKAYLYIEQKSIDDLYYLGYTDKFYAPYKGTVTCELLDRLRIDYKSQAWPISLDKEVLISLPHRHLIISTSQKEIVQTLQADEALKKFKFFFVDDEMQQTPTHYIVLAYYDLIEAIVKATSS